MKIKELPINERPRERLINNGKELLSNEELLTILIETGIKNVSAKTVSLNILKYVKDIKNLKDITYRELINIKGIGKAKACVLLSAIELSKRINNVDIINTKLNTPTSVYEYFKNKLSGLKQEHFYCIYLDNSKRVLDISLLFIGTINESLVHPREVFSKAYKLSASSIICVHNHPSNNNLPSNNDILTTKNLIQIGSLLGIKIVDHLIITNSGYYSLLEHGDI